MELDTGGLEGMLTDMVLHAALATQPKGTELPGLAEILRAQIGAEALARGAEPLIDGLTVVWAIEVPGATSAPEIVSERGPTFRKRLTRLGETDVYALAVSFPEGTTMQCGYRVDGIPQAHGAGEGTVEVYGLHPDSQELPGVPRGTLLPQPRWRSTIFADTVRDWWLYVPAQYDEHSPSCVMVFQDGGKHYTDHVPRVFDNLIAKGEMPVTIGIFLEPGTFADTTVSNRSFEYDTLSDQYVRFLLDEILPQVEQEYRLRDDAPSRAIGGFSSGGICAFTTAWQRPDQFSKVLSWAGSFTNIAAGPTLRGGGHNYAALIRGLPRKPIRVFLQGGANDLDNAWGNWPLANQEIAAALAFAGYDYQFVYGQGFHTPVHGRALLPDALRWLWRE